MAKVHEDIEKEVEKEEYYDAYKLSKKSTRTAVLLGIFITPFGYWYVGRTGLALLNFFTFNYFLLGPIIVPIHCYKMIEKAKKNVALAKIQK